MSTKTLQTVMFIHECQSALQVDRVAAALAERDVLVGPYGTMAEKLALKATSCVFSTDAAEKRHFDIRFSWCDPERKAGGKVEVIKVGSWNEAGPKTVTLPSAGLDVSPDPANKQDKNCEVMSSVCCVLVLCLPSSGDANHPSHRPPNRSSGCL
jgi:hypothetical protein